MGLSKCISITLLSAVCPSGLENDPFPYWKTIPFLTGKRSLSLLENDPFPYWKTIPFQAGIRSYSLLVYDPIPG